MFELLKRGLLARSRRAAAFDASWYLRQNPDVAASGVDPFVHYALHGAAEGRAPSPSVLLADQPLVESSGAFDPQWYLATYPEVGRSGLAPLAHFCLYGFQQNKNPGPLFDIVWYRGQNGDIGRMNPVVHYVRVGRDRGRPTAPPPGLIGAAQALLAGVGDLEPGLYAEARLRALDTVAVIDGQARGLAYAAFRDLFSRLNAPYDHIAFAPWLVRGGADLELTQALRAATTAGAKPLVVIVDHDRLEAVDWAPPGVDVVNVAGLYPRLDDRDRIDLIEWLVRAVRPHSVLNVNSRACWDAFVLRGRALAGNSALYAYVFCREYAEDGRPAGYVDTHLRDALEHLTRVYADNRAIVEDVAVRFALDAESRAKFLPLRQPSLGDFDWAPAGDDAGRLRVFWAGRLHRQKNTELLERILRAAPDRFEFDIWGCGADEETERLTRAAAESGRGRLRGSYRALRDLPLEEYDAFLYTSRWDGLPNVLIEVASLGVPIVSARVGGIAELLEGKAALIDDLEEAAPYLAALGAIAGDPDNARRVAAMLRAEVVRSHSWDAYWRALSVPNEVFARHGVD